MLYSGLSYDFLSCIFAAFNLFLITTLMFCFAKLHFLLVVWEQNFFQYPGFNFLVDIKTLTIKRH